MLAQPTLIPPYAQFLPSYHGPSSFPASSKSRSEKISQDEKGEKRRIYEGPAKIELMRYEHLPKVADTLEDAFLLDPHRHYTRDTPDSKGMSKFQNKVFKLLQSLSMADLVRQKMVYVVGGGDAMTVFVDAPSKKHKNKLGKLIEKLLTAAFKIGNVVNTPEQKRRAKEFQEKYAAAITEIFGDRLAELTLCGGLATTPAQQGKGYGGQLLDFITSKADADGRAMHLGSSNIANTAFYESHGFVEVGYILLGDNNPTWKEPPVKMLIMLREAKSKV